MDRPPVIIPLRTVGNYQSYDHAKEHLVKIFRKNPVIGIKDQGITSTTFRLKNEVIIAFAGGTPYSDVPSRFLAQRAMRGLRVPQPDYVSDELYQVCFVTSFRFEKVLSCLYYIKYISVQYFS